MALALLLAGHVVPVAGSDFDARVAEQKRKFEERSREMRRQFEERTAEMKRRSGEQKTPSQSGQGGAGPVGTSFNPLPFDAATAPPPGDCLIAFVERLKTVSSFSEIFPFLPYAEGQRIQEEEKRYDPARAAKRREELKRTSPDMDEEGIAHLTRSPYERSLKWQRDTVGSIIRVLSDKIEGNKAKVRVSIHSQARVSYNKGAWQDFPYGTATVVMLGENGYWRVQSFNSDGVHYKSPP